MSASSYLLSSVVEMWVGAALGSVGWMCTGFVSPADWKADSEAGFLARSKSLRSTFFWYSSISTAAICSSAIFEPFWKHSSAFYRFPVTVITPLGPGIFSLRYT